MINKGNVQDLSRNSILSLSNKQCICGDEIRKNVRRKTHQELKHDKSIVQNSQSTESAHTNFYLVWTNRQSLGR